MKIPLNIQQEDNKTLARAAQERFMENEIAACKKGDFEAEKRMVRNFMPLFTSLARKRSKDSAVINLCIEAGERGLKKAIRKYRGFGGSEKFRIFAVEYIEKSIDEVFQEKKGFFARFFG